MHFRFTGNPNTNNAGRLLVLNRLRAAKGLPALSLAQFESKLDAPLVDAAAKAVDAKAKQSRLF